MLTGIKTVAYWLLKTEPDTYSWDDLARDKKTAWEGITNATALIHIRKMKQGDQALVYHTGSERAVVGTAKIASDPYPDPKAKNEKIMIVDVEPGRKLTNPVSLDTIKTDATFEGWDLLRIGRLSVVPVPPKMWKRIEKLAGGRA